VPHRSIVINDYQCRHELLLLRSIGPRSRRGQGLNDTKCADSIEVIEGPQPQPVVEKKDVVINPAKQRCLTPTTIRGR
jgi:hypothetical protein